MQLFPVSDIMIREKTKKITAFLAILMFIATAIMAIPFVPDGTMTAKAATNNLSDLTVKYAWDCDADPVTPTLTEVNSSVAYINGIETGRKYAEVTLKEDNKSDYNTIYLTAGLSSNPGVQTLSGNISIPEQTGVAGVGQRPRMYVSLGGNANAGLFFNLLPGANDEVWVYNGTSQYKKWEIPRIPRGVWTEFIYSVDTDSNNLYFYLQLSNSNYSFKHTYIIPVGTATLADFNLFISSQGYATNLNFDIDDIKWYEEFFRLSGDDKTTEPQPVYYKDWDWKDYVSVWERTYDIAAGGDADDTKDGYVNLFDYTKDFETKKVVAMLNTTDYNTQINKTLSGAFSNIMFGGPISSSGLLHAVSWAAAHDKRVTAFIFDDYSSVYGSTGHTLSDFKTAEDELHKYSMIDVYGVIYVKNYENLNDTGWKNLDGALLFGWYGNDYASAFDVLHKIALSYYDSKNIYFGFYTHLYGDSTGMPPESIRYLFSKWHDEIQNGEAAGIVALGPARFLNYKNTDYAHQADANIFFSKEMMLGYNSDGSTVTVSKEEDGFYQDFDSVNVLLLNTSVKKITIKSEWNKQVEIQIPPSWSYEKIIVKDTNGTAVNWSKGSVIFNATLGHEYEIYENLPADTGGFWLTEKAQSLTWYQWLWIVAFLVVIMILVAVYASPTVNILPKHHTHTHRNRH